MTTEKQKHIPCTCDANVESIDSCERHGPQKRKQIPDLWEIAHLPELNGYTLGGISAKDHILNCWHMAHDLQKLNTDLLEACKAAIEWDELSGAISEWDSIRAKLLTAIQKATL